MFGGTSMACPVVAGNLALAESAWKISHPGRRLPAPSYWKNLLASTATDLGYPALDESSGLVNGAAAVREVLRQGKSFLASVSADPRNPSSWSARIAGGARAATTIAVRNTGATTERVTLTPFRFSTLKTITHAPITLTGPDYTDSEQFTVPAGTRFVQARVTWPSGPDISLESAVYDSNGDFVSFGQTSGGYGHLSFDQISLVGPAAQRPAVVKGKPWEIDIFPTFGMEPTADQTVHLQIAFAHRVTATSIALSRRTVTIKPGAVTHVRATVTAPQAAGTSFAGIAVGNGATTTTIPVAVRVPVKLTNGQGTFGGTITGSTVEYAGGEFYFYDVKVPAGTTSITAALRWPETGNLVDLYLIDPSGDLRDAKGGDLLWYPDYSSAGVPDAAFDHTAEQVIWDAPQAGTWQVLVWAAGFNGDSFAEPYSGSVVLDTPVVAPASWSATAPAGGTAGADFTLTNAGTTALPAYVESQATSDGTALYDDVALDPVTGTLTGTTDGISPIVTFTLPQNVSQVTARATWTGRPRHARRPGPLRPQPDRQGREPRHHDPGQRGPGGRPAGRSVDPHPGLRRSGAAAGRRRLHGQRRLRGADGDPRICRVGHVQRAGRGRTRRQRHDPRDDRRAGRRPARRRDHRYAALLDRRRRDAGRRRRPPRRGAGDDHGRTEQLAQGQSRRPQSSSQAMAASNCSM